MKREILLKNLKLMGYPLFEIDENPDGNSILAEIAKTSDPRLWEGFPLVLANCLKEGIFDYNITSKYLKKDKERTHFNNLILMSFALYEFLHLKTSWADNLSKYRLLDKRVYNKFLNNFKNKEEFDKIKGLSSVRIVNTFQRYFNQEAQGMQRYVDMKDEFDLEYALSQLFSRKQKELFKKKLKNEKLTKTEREYYSRSVRKKVLALSNPDLHKLAVKLTSE